MAMSRKERMKKDPPDTYVIYPDYWKDNWGEKPILGFVSAYSDFEAVRQAYTRNLLRKNFTVSPAPLRIEKREVKKYKSIMRDQKRYRRRA